MANTWSKESYRLAAMKHYRNCQYIFNQIPTINDAQYKNHVVSDCYYVGGYVMECALKFFVMSKNHLSGSYNKVDLDGHRLLNHNLQLLWQMACEGSDPLPLEWKQLCELTKRWSEDVRYDKSVGSTETRGITENFRKDMESVFSTVFSNF